MALTIMRVKRKGTWGEGGWGAGEGRGKGGRTRVKRKGAWAGVCRGGKRGVARAAVGAAAHATATHATATAAAAATSSAHLPGCPPITSGAFWCLLVPSGQRPQLLVYHYKCYCYCHSWCTTTSATATADARPAAAATPARPPAHLFRELVPVHAGLEAVPKVNVQQLPAVPVQHEVGRVPVPQAQDVADHAHDRGAARVRRTPVKPHLAVAALEPQDLGGGGRGGRGGRGRQGGEG